MSILLRKKKAAIFDLDGTLLDSVGVWHEVDRVFLSRRGIAVTDDYMQAIAHMDFPRAAVYTKNRFSLCEEETSIMAEWRALAIDAYTYHVPLKPHAEEYLASLHRRGIPIAAATASQSVFYQPALERLGILRYFSSITETSEVVRGKGFPDVYLRAAEKLSAPVEDCAVFEDIVPGIRGAADGGFYTVGVYDPHNPQRELFECLCDRCIYSYSELLQHDIF